MSYIKDKLEDIINSTNREYKEFKKTAIRNCRNRSYEYYGFENAEDMLGGVEPDDELQDTIREQGYLEGLKFIMKEFKQ